MTDGTLLFRQVNPSWVQAGRITSQVFKPTPKDKNRLSVYDGDRITAEESWRHYTGPQGFSSVGVVAVTVGECKSHDLPAEPDPLPFPEHVVICFDGCSGTQIEKKARHLKKAAETRGWLYRVEADAV
jgi:hypothetical protein